MDDGQILDRNDPNYSSNEENKLTISGSATTTVFDRCKKKVTMIIEEYFATDDITSTANELRDLQFSYLHFMLMLLLLQNASCFVLICTFLDTFICFLLPYLLRLQFS